MASVLSQSVAKSAEGGKFVGSSIGKALTGAAGLLLFVGVLRSTFYVVKVGQRGVLMRGGKPIQIRSGEVMLKLASVLEMLHLQILANQFYWWGSWRRHNRPGKYKIKRPGVKIKFPGLYDVEKVNVQRRVQKLNGFEVDTPDGQRHIDADMVTRVPCDDDGPDFYDYPARSIIMSSEADDVFESWAGSTLMSVLERCPDSLRSDREALFKLVNKEVSHEFDRVGYLMEGINMRSRARTFAQVLVDGNFNVSALNSQFSGSNVAQFPQPVAEVPSFGFSDQ